LRFHPFRAARGVLWKEDDQTRKDFKKDFEKYSWFEKYWEPESNMNRTVIAGILRVLSMLALAKSWEL